MIKIADWTFAEDVPIEMLKKLISCLKIQQSDLKKDPESLITIIDSFVEVLNSVKEDGPDISDKTGFKKLFFTGQKYLEAFLVSMAPNGVKPLQSQSKVTTSP